MMTPAITFLIRSLDVGGAERQLVELATGLHRRGWRVKVVTFYPGGPLEKDLRKAQVPMVSMNKRGRWDLGFLWRLARYLRSDGADILHGYLPLSNILLVLLRPKKGVPVVWGVRASNMDLGRYDWLARVEFMLANALSRFADLVVCNSEAGRAYHVAGGLCAPRLVVIPNGIDTARFRPDPHARAELRREWGVGDREKVVGVVARLDVMKDHPNFLRAAARVSESHPGTRFVCVGGGAGHYREELRALATTLGLDRRLHWVDLRDDVWRVYNALDVAVLSSAFGEGFPNVVAEAMATGVPCVVTDVGDAAAVVGGRGWVCPPRDSAALAQGIAAALEAEAGLRHRLRERVCGEFSSEALLERTAACLLELLGIPRAAHGTRPAGAAPLPDPAKAEHAS